MNSPNQSGISTYFIKNHQVTTPPGNKNKRPLNSPDIETPPGKKANMSDKLPPDLKLLYDSLSQKWDERMDPLEAKVNALFSAEANLPKHIEVVNEMKLQHGKLEMRLTEVEKENVELKQKLTEIEDQMLETSVVLTGIPEDKWEDAEPRRTLINKELSVITQGENDEEKLVNATAIKIVKTERIGRYNPIKGRPIAIKFAFKSDAEWLLSSRKSLNKGIFVDRQYSDETEYERKRLRPILSAARRLKDYRGRCKMEGTELVICGKRYNWNNLEELPEDLSTHTVSSKQDASYFGFFGELNPLSNFYPAPFIHEGVYYTTSEQYIQARKAEFCGDAITKQQIMQAKTALRCKTLGKEIQNCNNEKWNQAAAEQCFPGILSKFQQNAGIASFLKNTGSKTILECCYDDVWGNGIPLSHTDCINPKKFKRQGILGSMLEQVRDILRNRRADNDKSTTSARSELHSIKHSCSATLPVETVPTAD